MSKMNGRENDSVEIVDEVAKSDVALREEAMQAFWREQDIFNKSVTSPAGKVPVGEFVFYDGPPFATGLPHYGHILASTIKDAIPRFWTMNGYRVERKWGWDCHGLPLENLIEKKLGLGTKRDIEEYGVQNFNEAARDAVLEYADDWKQVIPRMGRFVDMEHDYKTMDSSYTESVWWVFKTLHEKGLVYEGFKSMHLCPRCGTTLSNFEVNQGYKDIKDIAVTVKLPLLDGDGIVTDTSLLVWTTTPWTLPGNTAAAVHNEIEYVKVALGDEKVILAKGRLAQLGDVAYAVLEEMKGADLVGKKYQPPFQYMKTKLAGVAGVENAWTIYHADYVEVGEEGTGAVHIAPAYGDDDMKLAQAHNVPIEHHVDEAGHFKSFVTDFAGQLVKPKDDEVSGIDHKDADIEILKHLQSTGQIFKKENITHSYPHCWRCETPLLNYATTSWFVEVTKMKDQMVEANNKVNWIPEHVGTNRFGKWLEGARDWAISRQRYWGAPLPIWRNPETKEYKVIGSLNELQAYVPKSGNQYFLMRHGESDFNVKQLLNSDVSVENPITEHGVAQVKAALKDLPNDIDYIFYSPLQRTTQTAQLLAAELGLAPETLIVDDRIRESDLSAVEGMPHDAKSKMFPDPIEEFTKVVDGMENLNQVRKRVGDFITDLDRTYQGKNILIVSHGDPLWMLDAVMQGATMTDAASIGEQDYPMNAQVRKRSYVAMPHNDNYELDFHRPYIDTVELFEGEVKLERVPDVFDCWFESGSMPYAQQHYMGAALNDFDPKTGHKFPAQFIAEGLDQTRGWFYSLTVLGVALFGTSPFENVIVNGTMLAEDGRKMSKKLQNYPDPMQVAHTAGADAMRFYLLSSPVIRGEDLNFTEKEVLEIQRKNIGRLHNVLQMYEMFADGTKACDSSEQVLDKWIISRMNQVVQEVTAGYEGYELDKATRPITDLIDDISVWYLRRSRDRLKGDDVEDKKRALATLRYTLRTLALTMAPVMPFYAEYLWQAIKDESEAISVHLAAWPKEQPVSPDLIAGMSATREIVSRALEARTKSGIKVRQPINAVTGPVQTEELQKIILEELNAKVYLVGESVSIDTTLTPALLAEGVAREFIRGVQEGRKAAGLEAQDKVELTVETSSVGQTTLENFIDMITKTVGAESVVFADTTGTEIKAENISFVVSIKKL